MVNTEIPNDYTVSPSCFSAAPQLKINHEATFDLDSSNAFEGPEKLLEVWFAPSPALLPPGAQQHGLKAVELSAGGRPAERVEADLLAVSGGWSPTVAITCHLGGRPVFRGTRYSVERVLKMVGAGWTVEQIADEYLGLEAVHVQAAAAFAAELMRDEMYVAIGQAQAA